MFLWWLLWMTVVVVGTVGALDVRSLVSLLPKSSKHHGHWKQRPNPFLEQLVFMRQRRPFDPISHQLTTRTTSKNNNNTTYWWDNHPDLLLLLTRVRQGLDENGQTWRAYWDSAILDVQVMATSACTIREIGVPRQPIVDFMSEHEYKLVKQQQFDMRRLSMQRHQSRDDKVMKMPLLRSSRSYNTSWQRHKNNTSNIAARDWQGAALAAWTVMIMSHAPTWIAVIAAMAAAQVAPHSKTVQSMSRIAYTVTLRVWTVLPELVLRVWDQEQHLSQQSFNRNSTAAAATGAAFSLQPRPAAWQRCGDAMLMTVDLYQQVSRRGTRCFVRDRALQRCGQQGAVAPSDEDDVNAVIDTAAQTIVRHQTLLSSSSLSSPLQLRPSMNTPLPIATGVWEAALHRARTDAAQAEHNRSAIPWFQQVLLHAKETGWPMLQNVPVHAQAAARKWTQWQASLVTPPPPQVATTTWYDAWRTGRAVQAVAQFPPWAATVLAQETRDVALTLVDNLPRGAPRVSGVAGPEGQDMRRAAARDAAATLAQDVRDFVQVLSAAWYHNYSAPRESWIVSSPEPTEAQDDSAISAGKVLALSQHDDAFPTKERFQRALLSQQLEYSWRDGHLPPWTAEMVHRALLERRMRTNNATATTAVVARQLMGVNRRDHSFQRRLLIGDSNDSVTSAGPALPSLHHMDTTQTQERFQRALLIRRLDYSRRDRHRPPLTAEMVHRTLLERRLLLSNSTATTSAFKGRLDGANRRDDSFHRRLLQYRFVLESSLRQNESSTEKTTALRTAPSAPPFTSIDEFQCCLLKYRLGLKAAALASLPLAAPRGSVLLENTVMNAEPDLRRANNVSSLLVSDRATGKHVDAASVHGDASARPPAFRNDTHATFTKIFKRPNDAAQLLFADGPLGPKQLIRTDDAAANVNASIPSSGMNSVQQGATQQNATLSRGKLFVRQSRMRHGSVTPLERPAVWSQLRLFQHPPDVLTRNGVLVRHLTPNLSRRKLGLSAVVALSVFAAYPLLFGPSEPWRRLLQLVVLSTLAVRMARSDH